jgi:hypothetical protein
LAACTLAVIKKSKVSTSSRLCFIQRRQITPHRLGVRVTGPNACAAKKTLLNFDDQNRSWGTTLVVPPSGVFTAAQPHNGGTTQATPVDCHIS